MGNKNGILNTIGIGILFAVLAAVGMVVAAGGIRIGSLGVGYVDVSRVSALSTYMVEIQDIIKKDLAERQRSVDVLVKKSNELEAQLKDTKLKGEEKLELEKAARDAKVAVDAAVKDQSEKLKAFQKETMDRGELKLNQAVREVKEKHKLMFILNRGSMLGASPQQDYTDEVIKVMDKK